MIPEGIVDSEWPRIEQRISDMAIVFDRWQTNLGELILGLTVDGRYAATVGGVTLSIPRQVGKTFTIGVLVIALCIEFPGLTVMWTAHHGRTTTKTFRSIQGIVKRKRVAPHLAVGGGIRVANGEQEISFANGSLIMFGAREHGFGRGIDGVDVIVFDEAQILGEKALEDMVATTNQSRHEHGALLFYMGTPPRPEDNGEAFANKRRKALDGSMRNGVYVECSADEDADPDDRKQWAIANPSYPHHTPAEAMERMRENLPSDASWRLEAYGIWDRLDEHLAVIPAPVWEALHDAGPPDGIPPDGIGVDASHDGVLVAAGCWRTEDVSHVELLAVDNWTDDEAAADGIAALTGRRIKVIIDGASPAARLIPLLKGRKVKVLTGGANDMSKGCIGLYTGVLGGKTTHGGEGDDLVTKALAGAVKRKIGEAGGWGWDRRDPDTNIAPLVAVTLARYVASHSSARRGGAEVHSF